LADAAARTAPYGLLDAALLPVARRCPPCPEVRARALGLPFFAGPGPCHGDRVRHRAADDRCSHRQTELHTDRLAFLTCGRRADALVVTAAGGGGRGGRSR
jgi:hypothetical protein